MCQATGYLCLCNQFFINKIIIMETEVESALLLLDDCVAAAARLKGVVLRTPLQYNAGLSARYHCDVYLKREDLQVVRSYKLRGAYNMMCTLPPEQLQRGVVCASAGNHAQGVAYSCRALQVPGFIFMPVTTPGQKLRRTEFFGKEFVTIQLAGDTFDDCAVAAADYARAHGLTMIPPFDDPRIIAGQATVGLEIAEELADADYCFVPVGGGGLAAGAGGYLKQLLPGMQLIGVEPAGAPSMTEALRAGRPVTLEQIDKFVDGAAVKRVGAHTFRICSEVLDDMCLVHEGKVCATILKLYNEEAIVAEPAGALAIAALDQYAAAIKGKKVVCIVSGSNNDIDRMPEIRERNLQYKGLKHYFLIRFAQRPGALKEFVNEVLGAGDDITRFEYIQKHNKESGPALVGIQLQQREDYERLIANMARCHINYTVLVDDDNLYGYVV
jgi:threonine dehydratase